MRRHRGMQPRRNLRNVLHEPQEHRKTRKQPEQRCSAVPQFCLYQEAGQ